MFDRQNLRQKNSLTLLSKVLVLPIDTPAPPNLKSASKTVKILFTDKKSASNVNSNPLWSVLKISLLALHI